MRAVLATLWVSLLGAVAAAADTDKTALAQRAQAILKTNCYQCHGHDGSIEGGMNYVLDLKSLVVRKKVIPGDPAQSKLFKRVTSPDNPMPPVLPQ